MPSVYMRGCDRSRVAATHACYLIRTAVLHTDALLNTKQEYYLQRNQRPHHQRGGNRGFPSLGSGCCYAAVRRVLQLCRDVSLQHRLLECGRIVLHGEALGIHQILRGQEQARSKANTAAAPDLLDLQAHAR